MMFRITPGVSCVLADMVNSYRCLSAGGMKLRSDPEMVYVGIQRSLQAKAKQTRTGPSPFNRVNGIRQ